MLKGGSLFVIVIDRTGYIRFQQFKSIQLFKRRSLQNVQQRRTKNNDDCRTTAIH